jgi:hypothetical protein
MYACSHIACSASNVISHAHIVFPRYSQMVETFLEVQKKTLVEKKIEGQKEDERRQMEIKAKISDITMSKYQEDIRGLDKMLINNLLTHDQTRLALRKAYKEVADLKAALAVMEKRESDLGAVIKAREADSKKEISMLTAELMRYKADKADFIRMQTDTQRGGSQLERKCAHLESMHASLLEEQQRNAGTIIHLRRQLREKVPMKPLSEPGVRAVDRVFEAAAAREVRAVQFTRPSPPSSGDTSSLLASTSLLTPRGTGTGNATGTTGNATGTTGNATGRTPRPLQQAVVSAAQAAFAALSAHAPCSSLPGRAGAKSSAIRRVLREGGAGGEVPSAAQQSSLYSPHVVREELQPGSFAERIVRELQARLSKAIKAGEEKQGELGKVRWRRGVCVCVCCVCVCVCVCVCL